MIKMETVLNVKKLKKIFQKKEGKQHTAVNNISFELKKGEIFSFLGPNGSGKSTTINMLTTQLLPTSGEIYLKGQSIKTNPTFARSKIGIVAQHNNLDRGLTAFENLLYHGCYFGMTTIDSEKKATELLRKFGLTEWKNEYVRQFSGGMIQRLKIARAIMHEPEILFLDEPTTGLDPVYREILWQQVLHLNKTKQTTVFLTTHYMDEPEKFSDRVAIYNEGEIKAIGSIKSLRQMMPSSNIVSVQLEKHAKEITKELLQVTGVRHVVNEQNKFKSNISK